MAHRKFEHDKIQTVMPTWHGLEERFDPGKLTLNNCWLNQWDVVPTELQFVGGGATPFRTLVCSDKPEILVGNPYRESFVPVTNRAFLDMIQESTGGTDHELVSCGSVRNRCRTFASFRLKGMESFTAAGRKFSSHLNFGNGHDKSSVLWANTSNICTVCDNTFISNLFQIENKDTSASQTDDLKVMVRHTKKAQIRLPEISKLIDKAIGVQAKFQLELDNLAQISATRDIARELFAGALAPEGAEELSTRAENRIERLEELFVGGKGNRGQDLSDVFSAWTDYYSHESSGGDDRMKQFFSSEFGAAAVSKSRFWTNIVDPEKREAMQSRGKELMASN